MAQLATTVSRAEARHKLALTALVSQGKLRELRTLLETHVAAAATSVRTAETEGAAEMATTDDELSRTDGELNRLSERLRMEKSRTVRLLEEFFEGVLKFS